MDDQSISWLLHYLLHRADKTQQGRNSRKMSTVAILGFHFGRYHDVAPLSFLRNISLASLLSSLTIFDWSDLLQILRKPAAFSFEILCIIVFKLSINGRVVRGLFYDWLSTMSGVLCRTGPSVDWSGFPLSVTVLYSTDGLSKKNNNCLLIRFSIFHVWIFVLNQGMYLLRPAPWGMVLVEPLKRYQDPVCWNGLKYFSPPKWQVPITSQKRLETFFK